MAIRGRIQGDLLMRMSRESVRETLFRLILKDNIPDITLIKFLPGEGSAIVEHADGTRGVVFTEAILNLEAERCKQSRSSTSAVSAEKGMLASTESLVLVAG